MIYDARSAQRSTTGPLAARGIIMHVLSDGMTFDPSGK
jgi:hypothetical protein